MSKYEKEIEALYSEAAPAKKTSVFAYSKRLLHNVYDYCSGATTSKDGKKDTSDAKKKDEKKKDEPKKDEKKKEEPKKEDSKKDEKKKDEKKDTDESAAKSKKKAKTPEKKVCVLSIIVCVFG
jgi:hypothetical protein